MVKLPTPRGPIIVVGDIMCDHYVWGDVDRISPEAPVQVLKWEREANLPGGAANAAMNLAALGCEVHLVGTIGRDAEGSWLLGSLRSNGIGTSGVTRSKGRATIVKTRVVARSQHLLRIDREPRAPIDEPDVRQMLAAIGKLTKRAAGILCSDYNKGVLSVPVLRACLGRGSAFTVVDPKSRDFRKYRGAHLLTPNERELMDASGDSDPEMRGDAIVRRRARFVMRRYGFKALLVTRGASGMDLFGSTRNQIEITHIPALQRHEVFDVTGAGDTVAAAMVMGGASGLALPEAARLANAAAGLVVGSVGTAVADRDALERIMNGESSQARAKVLARAALAARIKDARRQGLVVALTSGTYDTLSVTDLRALQRARAECDVLVVGVQARGEVGQKRAELVAALRFVDYVTVFSDGSAASLARALRPDRVV
jgi:D-beta-D-heptose 7-phosphate kinase/D-beta-D-heptose 1-phosphate adenosyltransferase